MKMVEYVSEEQKNNANSVNIVEYLLSIGEPLKSDGHLFFRHEDHDSLVINAKKNYFSWNSRNISGNAVTYLMHVHDLSFQQAVQKINEDMKTYDIANYNLSHQTYPHTFNYKVNEVPTTEHIVHYLVEDRHIDPVLVQSCIKADLIKEDSFKNVVFKWKEKGELIGASLQGTREIPIEKRLSPDRAYFKKVLPTTQDATHSGFSITKGYPEKLYFFESPIDLLSYVSLNKSTLTNCRLQSMEGLKHETILRTVNKTEKDLNKIGRKLESIMLCVDNDEAGKKFVTQLQTNEIQRTDGRVLSVKSDMPTCPNGQNKWDWNNVLKEKTKQSLKKKVEMSLDL